MAICVTNKHLYVQFVDDDAARTLAAASSLQVGDAAGCNLAGAKQVGERAAQAAREQGIRMVVVDRGGFRYHGRVRQIVESAVAAGLCIARGAAAATEEAT
jgi:large subunit ribosomal protein L18